MKYKWYIKTAAYRPGIGRMSTYEEQPSVFLSIFFLLLFLLSVSNNVKFFFLTLIYKNALHFCCVVLYLKTAMYKIIIFLPEKSDISMILNWGCCHKVLCTWALSFQLPCSFHSAVQWSRGFPFIGVLRLRGDAGSLPAILLLSTFCFI